MDQNRDFRHAILALALGSFAIGTSEFAAMGLLPYFAADLGISEPQAGHVISAYALGVVVGAPLTSVLGARLPRRRYLAALMAFYEVKIPRAIQAKLILSVENDELNIPAGLQDRVIQAYEGVVFMNFDRETMDRQGFGDYEELDPALLPPLYIAYSTRLSEGTEVFHNDIRSRFNRGEREVVDAMQTWAGLAQRTRDLLVAGRGGEIGPLLDANFDLRRKLYRVSDGNLRMVETARRCGATAKFTGSGGAIVGTCDDEPMFRRLVESLEPLGMKVIKPLIAAGREAAD